MKWWLFVGVAPLVLIACSPIPRPGSWRTEALPSQLSSVQESILLSDGRVLFIGSFQSQQATTIKTTAAIFDPGDDSWRAASPPPIEVFGATFTALANGSVLLAGGVSQETPGTHAYLYFPDQDQWRRTGDMLEPRADFTATRLLDGRVLVAGGEAFGKSLASCEFYDPRSGSWTSAPSLPGPRVYQTSVLLGNGRVMLAGGDMDFDSGGGFTPGPSRGSFPYGSEEVFSVGTETWSELRPPEPVEDPSVVPLPDGHALFVGGHFGKYPSPFVYLYDPMTGTWSDRASSKAGGEPALLKDGRLFFAYSPYTYDPTQDLWMPATEPPTGLILFQSPIALDNGLALSIGGGLLAGGARNFAQGESLALYDPAGFPPLPGSAGPLATPQFTRALAITALILLALLGLRHATSSRPTKR